MRPITKDDLTLLQHPRQKVWDLGNRVLYDLCKRHPTHKTDEEIVAKIWLIGRSYAASIERRKNAKQIGDDFYVDTVAPMMRSSEIDSWLVWASNTSTPGTPETISVHKRLMDCFKSITDLGKRSLASKYLHFHLPDKFYIYDSRARQAITKVVPRLNQITDIAVDNYDQEYKDFVRRCTWLRDRILANHRTLLSPREIDKLLLAIADGEIEA
jgi:hypothetical protein